MIRLPSLVALVFAALAAGCSSSPTEAPASSSADVTANDPDQLRDAAIVSGEIVVGQSATVGYFGGYDASGDQNGDLDAWQLPYLGWRITKPNAPAANALTPSVPVNTKSAPLSISVSGDFPGMPEVLVVDESYNVLASTHAHREHGLDVATLQVDDTPGAKLVLVRDKLWVLPMSFDINVTQ